MGKMPVKPAAAPHTDTQVPQHPRLWDEAGMGAKFYSIGFLCFVLSACLGLSGPCFPKYLGGKA